MRLKNTLHSVFMLISITTFSQGMGSWDGKPALSIYGFVDTFYMYDFNEPSGNQRQSFLFNHNRHNEYNLNLGLLKFNLEHSRYRANLAFQSGTYAQDNYAEESGVFKTLFEANVGVALNSQQDLWLDVGIFPSHLGFESAVSLQNYTLTRSLSAESSPYFLAGAKLTYQASETLEITGLMVNGWQRIQRVEGNSLPSFGTQLNYKASDLLTLNWSTFIGTDDPDITRRMRYFSNMYGQFDITNDFHIIAGFDVGAQQKDKDRSSYDLWFTPAIIGQYSINSTWSAALRAEYYQDKNGVIIPSATTQGFRTTGLSINLDYSPTPNLACRLESRWFGSKDAIFEKGNTPKNSNLFIGGSVAIQFMEMLSN